MDGEQRMACWIGLLVVTGIAVLFTGGLIASDIDRKQKVELEKLRLDAGYTSLALPDGGTATVWLPRIKK